MLPHVNLSTLNTIKKIITVVSCNTYTNFLFDKTKTRRFYLETWVKPTNNYVVGFWSGTIARIDNYNYASAYKRDCRCAPNWSFGLTLSTYTRGFKVELKALTAVFWLFDQWQSSSNVLPNDNRQLQLWYCTGFGRFKQSYWRYSLHCHDYTETKVGNKVKL